MVTLLGACGSTESHPPNPPLPGAGPRLGIAGARAVAGSAAAAGSSSSSGGSPAWTDDGRAEACWEYGQQVCGLLARCSGSPQPACLQHWLLECPDELFSDGSPATAEDVLACAAQWRDGSCDELVAGRPPNCLPAGTKAVGESCAFGRQCESGSCFPPNGCGACRPLPAADAPCSSDSCPVGQQCWGEHCVTSPSLLPRAHVGQPCSDRTLCDASTVCYGGQCSTQPLLGEACELELGCAEGYCEAGLCVPPATVDESCKTVPCGRGLRCVAPRAGILVCRPLGDNPECTDDSNCNPGDTCHLGTCVALVGFQAACDAQHLCFDLAVCVDGTCRARLAENVYANRCHLDP